MTLLPNRKKMIKTESGICVYKNSPKTIPQRSNLIDCFYLIFTKWKLK